MIAPLVHLREDTRALIGSMIELVDLYRRASPGEYVRIVTSETGWGGMIQGSVRVLKDRRGGTVVSAGSAHDPITIALDDGSLTWDPSNERPTLDQLRDVLVAMLGGRMRHDDDPIEILANDLAIRMSLDDLLRNRGFQSGIMGTPRVIVEAPGKHAGKARIAWMGPIGMDEDAGYLPSPALARRLSSLPTELAVSHVKKAITCAMRTHNSFIRRRDTIDTLRAMAGTSLAESEFLERNP